MRQTERPHPLTPFIRGWVVFVALVYALGRQFLPDGSGDRQGLRSADLRWVLLAVLGSVVLAAAAGFVSWWFTRFVIDEHELRIETGALFKNSKKVPFERVQSVDLIQPFAARIFGLSELRIEAGAGDSTIKLRYLSRTQAGALRDYLLTRAHGRSAAVAPVGTAARASALTDLGAADHPLVTVTPGRLIGSFLLTSEWLVSALFVVAALVATAIFHVTLYALPGLIPLLLGAVSMIGRRVVAMFHFTLAESPRGLRITRGLANLTSQSVPVGRIQGVKLCQPLLWRPFGWYRVDVDVLGYADGNSENNSSGATSVLLPVADREQVAVALARVLPGAALDQIELHRSPRRARWLSWFDFWTLRYGWDDRMLITQHGWLVLERNLVPHAKTQSVRIRQGPLQRRLGLADVHVDTPKGPVNAVAHQLDVAAARELALSQLDRARAARRADRERVPVAELSPHDDRTGEDAVLGAFHLSGAEPIGSGSTSRVYALDAGHVLRIHRHGHEAAQETAQLRALYDSWAGTPVGLELPRITDGGTLAGRGYTVDRRLSGHSLSSWLTTATPAQRREALGSYLHAATALPRLPSPVPGFARLVGERAPQQFPSLVALLTFQLQQALAVSSDRLEHDLPELRQVWDHLQHDLARRVCVPSVVHGDLRPTNAYLSAGPGGAPVVSGIDGFGPHTLAADPYLDVAGAICLLELESYPEAAADAAWLLGLAVQRLGADAAEWVAVYRRYHAFRLSTALDSEPAVYAWCLRALAPVGVEPVSDPGAPPQGPATAAP